MSPLRVLILTAALLTATLVFAPPAQAAVDPCYKENCVITYVDDGYACAGTIYQWETYGICAGADPACVGVRSGRNWQETCVPPQPAAAKGIDCQKLQVCPIVVVSPERVCAGAAIGLQGAAGCIEPVGCASVHYGFNQDKVCVQFAASADPCDHLSQCPVRPIVGSGPFGTCVGVAFESGGAAECVDLESGCVYHIRGFSYSETCVDTRGILA